MNRWIITAAAAALCGTAGRAQEAAAIPTATVNYTALPVRIDGKLDDPAWKDAAVITLDKTWDGKMALKGATVRLLWDKTWLYMSAQVPDDLVVAGRLPRDGFLWEKDDVIELFLWPREDQPYYYEIVVNPRPTLYDAFVIAKPTNDGPELTVPDWNPDIRVSTRLAPMLYRPDRLGDRDPEGYWAVEMAIPIASLSSRGTAPVQAGETWRAQINRYNRPDPGPGMLDATAWSPYDQVGAPYLLDRFGRLEFAGGPAAVIKPVVPETGAVKGAPVTPATPPTTAQPTSPTPTTPAEPATPTPTTPAEPATPTPPTPAEPATPTTPAEPTTPAPTASPTEPVSMAVMGMPIHTALDLLFKGTNKKYTLTPEAEKASPTVTVTIQDKAWDQAILEFVNAANLQYRLDPATGVYAIDVAPAVPGAPAAPETPAEPAAPAVPAPNTPPGS